MSNYVSENSILSIVKNNALDKITTILIDEANSGGGRDNITVAVVSH